jgi:hypothetical protein
VFLLETNAPLGVAALLLGPPSSDEEWIEYIHAVDGLNLEVRTDVQPILVQLLRGATMPSATTRKALAALRTRIRADAVNVVVSSSPLVRNAQTALDWLRKPHYTSTIHATTELAFAYLAKTRPSEDDRRVEALRRLVDQLESAERRARPTL